MNSDQGNVIETYIPKLYYFCFNDDYCKKVFTDFIKLINSINSADLIEIHLSSDGGNIDILYSMLRIINTRPDRFRLVVAGDCHSAGLFTILMVDCVKEFLPSFAGGILHGAWFMVNSNELDNKTSEGALRLKELKKHNTKVLKYIESLGIDSEKIKDAKAGKDVFLTRDEIISASKYKDHQEITFNI